ncbi:hypothetical protein [Pseudotamlana carrageenivorans]|nr:hypothetical protein [Tamlana carrageenivorans]
MFSQSFISSNIQSYLVDKSWSSEKNNDKKIMFKFKSDGSLHLFTAGNEVGYEDYYISTSSCSNLGNGFDSSKVGSSSAGNYIVTRAFAM